ncbi:WD repeat-containing protein 82 [Babesia sp. Xinjiang]|uniref:WD repeat-containing protein 82 n=1 Tax=Babesia sp. Xinjiang TaxID=462227 RepID=UPI000A24A664|nr:WD repeat-containing protein 82 [Babesia sp. Xinjiang]ORM42032.1 WD repeat-containing protein 82 [Babesia sp. Xinjiang]
MSTPRRTSKDSAGFASVDNISTHSFVPTNVPGIRLPTRTPLPPEVTLEDYEYAVSNLHSEYDALSNLVQRLRFEKLRKITFQDGWNPFAFQNADVCVPVPVEEIENYGFDEQTSSCKCPNNMAPCTRQQALDDLDHWVHTLRKLAVRSKFSRTYDQLQLATKHLNIVNIKGVLTQPGTLDSASPERQRQCNTVDAVLCSARDLSRASTDWSSWGGCSEKCNSGTQERFKITHNKGVRALVVDKRECSLAKCSDSNQHNLLQCSISIVPPTEYGRTVVRTCICPAEDSVICSSEEARITMNNWLPQFRDYCMKSLARSEYNILYKDLPLLKTYYLGRFIQLRFKDGYYFDCTERWGVLDKDDSTNYCKVGSPILCGESIAKSTARVSFLETPIEKDSLCDVTYNIYGKPIHSIWLCGTIISVDYEKELIDFDDGSGRQLQIKFTRVYVDSEILRGQAMADRDTLVTTTMEDFHKKTKLDDEVVKSFTVSLAFKDRFSITNGMDWDNSGEVMVTSSEDRTVYLYSLTKAGVTNVLQSKKHGVCGVRFTHEGPRHIVCSSSRDAPAVSVKLWDTMENRYIKSFSLVAPVVRGRGISPHPARDLMLISTYDNTCSLYSYDNSSPLVSYKGTSVVGAFDPLGLIFAVCDSSQGNKTLSLYDISKYQVPFVTFDLGNVLLKTEEVVVGLKRSNLERRQSIDFNPNGRCVILGTNYTRLLCINAVNGSALFACCYADEPSFIDDKNAFCYPSISPDGRYLLCGRTNGSLSIWNFKGQSVGTLLGHKGETVWRRLFRKRAALRAIFRSLGELEQLIILRLLSIKQAVSERALRLWMNPNSFTDLRKALSIMQSYHIIQVSDNRTKDGKQQYELHKDFKNSMLCEIYDIPCEFEKGLQLIGNVGDVLHKDTKSTPSIGTLLKYSKERLDFLVLFLVSSEVRRHTLRANKVSKKLKKLEKLRENDVKNPILFKKVKSLERQLLTLTKHGGTVSMDLLRIFERFNMISEDSKKNKLCGADSGMSRQALSWLLKGVDSQLIILIVGHLQQIEGGYLSGCIDIHQTKTDSEAKEGVDDFTDSDDKATVEKIDLATSTIIESLDLLLSLSQARFGDVFRMTNLTKAQQRLLKLLIELGLVYSDSSKGKFYVSDLSFLVDRSKTDSGEAPKISMSICGAKESKIVVQSNFKVYVYTANALQISVLSHICELQARTPNLVIGVLTRSSVQAAFKSGISAEQIIRFFESKTQYDESNMNSTAVKVPENVRRQLKMWEAERNRLELISAILFKRWDAEFMPELFKRTVRWAQAKRYELFHTTWPSDIYSPDYRNWLENEKYLACTFESKEEVIDKIKQIRMSLSDEKNRSSGGSAFGKGQDL